MCIIPNELFELFAKEKTRALTDFYTSLALEDKTYFVQMLSEQYGIDHNLVEHLAGQIAPTAVSILNDTF